MVYMYFWPPGGVDVRACDAMRCERVVGLYLYSIVHRYSTLGPLYYYSSLGYIPCFRFGALGGGELGKVRHREYIYTYMYIGR